MEKYFVSFAIPAATMAEWMSKTDDATRKEQSTKMMDDWKTWMEKHAKAIVDKGGPIGKTKRVTKEGVADAKNDLVYYVVLETETPEAAVAIVQDSPHFDIPGAYVDVSTSNRNAGM